MPRIDFYILKENHPQARHVFTFRLLEKAYQQKNAVYIHTESKQEAYALDDFLWAYREDSFLPHYLYGEPLALNAPIQIGYGQTPENQHDILINLTQAIPAFYMQFQRVLEIIPAISEWQALARKNYKLYREQGWELQSHQI